MKVFPLGSQIHRLRSSPAEYPQSHHAPGAKRKPTYYF
jgi:hypothetical protein